MTPSGTLELPQQWAEAWQAAVKPLLRSDEKIVSWFEPNLTEQLRFGRGLVILTNFGILAHEVIDPFDAEFATRLSDPVENASASWKRWDFYDGLELRKVDRAGLGALELIDRSGLVASWRYTASQINGAATLVTDFRRLRSGTELENTSSVCPSCDGGSQYDTFVVAIGSIRKASILDDSAGVRVDGTQYFGGDDSTIAYQAVDGRCLDPLPKRKARRFWLGALAARRNGFGGPAELGSRMGEDVCPFQRQ